EGAGKEERRSRVTNTLYAYILTEPAAMPSHGAWHLQKARPVSCVRTPERRGLLMHCKNRSGPAADSLQMQQKSRVLAPDLGPGRPADSLQKQAKSGRRTARPGSRYAVLASLRPSSSIIFWRMTNFCTFPVTVMGKASTKRIWPGIL